MITLSALSLDGSIRLTNTDGTEDVLDIEIPLSNRGLIDMGTGFGDLFFYKLPNGKGHGGVPSSSSSLVNGFGTHTGATLAGSGTITSDSEAVSHEVWLSVDGSSATYWESDSDTTAYIRYQFETPKIAKKFFITTPDSANAPSDFEFQGSNNGTDWTTLGTGELDASWTNDLEVEFDRSSNMTAYSYYRLNVTDSTGTSIKVSIFRIEVEQISLINVGFYSKLIPMVWNSGTSQMVIDSANQIVTGFSPVDYYQTETLRVFEGLCSYQTSSNSFDAFYTRVEVYFKLDNGDDVLLFTSHALAKSSFAEEIESGQSLKGVHVAAADGADDVLNFEVKFNFTMSK